MKPPLLCVLVSLGLLVFPPVVEESGSYRDKRITQSFIPIFAWGQSHKHVRPDWPRLALLLVIGNVAALTVSKWSIGRIAAIRKEMRAARDERYAKRMARMLVLEREGYGAGTARFIPLGTFAWVTCIAIAEFGLIVVLSWKLDQARLDVDRLSSQHPPSSRMIEFEGKLHEFPNDATDAEIEAALRTAKSGPRPRSGALPKEFDPTSIGAVPVPAQELDLEALVEKARKR